MDPSEPQHRHDWLIPHPSRPAVLVDSSGGSPRLPSVSTTRFSMGAALDAAGERLGFEVVFLRLAAYVGADDVHGSEATAPIVGLREAAPPSPHWSPPQPFAWLDLERLDVAVASEPAFAEHVDRWRREQLGKASPPPRRPAWTRPGWFPEAAEWTRAACHGRGIQVTGEIRQVWQWVLSSILRVPTAEGTLYLKAAFPLFHHEPAVTQALARRHPGQVPDVVAVEAARGWLLMREIPGRQLGDLERGRWPGGARLLAEIQRAWVGRETEILALGGPDRRLGVHVDDLDGLPRHPLVSELPHELLARLSRSVSRFRMAADDLGRCGIPDSIVHGDFHLWNVMADGERLVIYDWSDAAVAHPFLDIETFFEETLDDEIVREVTEAYLAGWEGVAEPAALRRALHLARPLSALYQVISYVRILETIEPDDASDMDEAPRRWLERALDLAEALDRR